MSDTLENVKSALMQRFGTMGIERLMDVYLAIRADIVDLTRESSRNEIERLQSELKSQASAIESLQRDLDSSRRGYREYEEKYILPCFKWAEEVGYDLQEAVYRNPGRNCVELFVNHLTSFWRGARDYGESLDAIRQALGQEGTHFLDELEEFQFGWLKTALLKCGYREDVQALRHFVFHARLNGASNTCLLCLRSCDEDDEGHLADCPYFVALERVSAPGVETLVEWADRQ